MVGVVITSRLQWGNKGGKQTSSTGIKNDVYEKANALLSDVILNYKTVIAFGDRNVEPIFMKFEALMEDPLNRRIKNAHIAGFAFGYSVCNRMIFMGIVFYIGSITIGKWGYDPESVYLCINVLILASMGTGMAMSNIPSIGRAKASAKTIFDIIDEKSTLDVRDGHKSPL